MADYLTGAAALIDAKHILQPAKISKAWQTYQRLREKEGPIYGLDPDERMGGLEISFTGKGQLYIRGEDDDFNASAFIEIISQWVKNGWLDGSVGMMVGQWCSKNVADAFGGGYIRITNDGDAIGIWTAMLAFKPDDEVKKIYRLIRDPDCIVITEKDLTESMTLALQAEGMDGESIHSAVATVMDAITNNLE
jgi:hypothetical protein